MSVVNYDNQIILHCDNCAGSFFEENGINRISQQSAYELSQNKKSDEISGLEKKCPNDETILIALHENESIPSDVTLLQCQKCKGVFAFPDDLIRFKKAQEVKVSYFKTWGIPLPSLKAVVILSFVALVSAAVFSRYLLFQQGSLGQTQAQNLIKKISFSRSGRYLFIYFNSTLPLRSSIVFTDTKNGNVFTEIVSSKPTTLHHITTTDISFTESFTYHVVLIDGNGKEVKTEEKKLELK